VRRCRARDRREVDHGVDAANRVLDRAVLAHVPAPEPQVVADAPGEVRGRARRQRVEHDHVADALVRQQLRDQRAPDVAAAAGDEDARLASRPLTHRSTRRAGTGPREPRSGPARRRAFPARRGSLLQGLLLSADQIEEPVVLHLHLVFLVLVARVLVVFHRGVEVELVADLGDRLRELDDGDRAGDLIVDVDPVVAGVSLLDEPDEALDVSSRLTIGLRCSPLP